MEVTREKICQVYFRNSGQQQLRIHTIEARNNFKWGQDWPEPASLQLAGSSRHSLYCQDSCSDSWDLWSHWRGGQKQIKFIILKNDFGHCNILLAHICKTICARFISFTNDKEIYKKQTQLRANFYKKASTFCWGFISILCWLQHIYVFKSEHYTGSKLLLQLPLSPTTEKITMSR